MMDSTESIPQPARDGARWLLLLHQLPPRPDYLRVKVRRRLHRIGAVALRNAVYVLPAVPDALEDFQWLRREIVDAGGEATICASAFVEGATDGEIEALLRRERAGEYARLIDDARAVDAPGERDVVRLRRRLARIAARDHLGVPDRAAAEAAVRALESRLAGREPRTARGPAERRVGAVWVTRAGVYVDRIASAWLIARFIDPAARFRFVAADHAPSADEVRFDMFEGEYTHEGDRCTFEVLLERFGLDDAALAAIGGIVHDIDFKDDRYRRDETEGIRSLLDGIVAIHSDDEARIAAGRIIFDGLFEHFRRA